jgi:hypothetical protein
MTILQQGVAMFAAHPDKVHSVASPLALLGLSSTWYRFGVACSLRFLLSASCPNSDFWPLRPRDSAEAKPFDSGAP